MGTPTLERSQEALERSDAERAYWEDHLLELLEKYPEQFVAVKDGSVIAAAPDLQQLVTILEKESVDFRDLWVRFVTKDPRRVLL